MEFLQSVLSHPLGQAVATGVTAAVAVDLTTFMKSKGPGEFFEQFSVHVALWRYLQGAIGGLCGGLGISVVV